ncbi:MAG: alkaline phosphatase family protein [Planctomycetota bacterium]
MMPTVTPAVDFRRPLLLLSLLLVLVGGVSCSNGEVEPHTKLLVIGVDGMEWSVMLPLLQKNELPNIQKLMDRGTYGQLRTFNPTLSPIIWTSIATGKTKEQHGILGFDKVDPDTRRQTLFTSLDRKVKAVWDILSERERQVDVFGWWITWPAERLDGHMVSQFSGLGQKDKVWKGTVTENGPAQTYPRSYEGEILPIVRDVNAEFETPEEGTFPARVRELFGQLKPEMTELEQRLLDDSIWSFKADETYARITERALESSKADLTMCYFGGTDVVGHRFWRYHEPQRFQYKPSAEAMKAFSKIIPDYYRYIDSVIGRLLAKCDDDTAVMIVADHGMVAVNTTLDLEAEYAKDKGLAGINSGHHPDAEPGVIIAAGAPFRNKVSPKNLRPSDLESLGSVYQVTPTILHLMGLPVGEDMKQAVMETALQTSFMEDHPTQFIPTWDDDPDWFARRSARAFEGVDEEKMDQLRRLGYIGANGQTLPIIAKPDKSADEKKEGDKKKKKGK